MTLFLSFFQRFGEAVYGFTLLSYDYFSSFSKDHLDPLTDEKTILLIQSCRLFLQTLNQIHLSKIVARADEVKGNNGRIITFLEVLKRFPIQIQKEITLGVPIPEILISNKFLEEGSPITADLTNILKEEFQRIAMKESESESESGSNPSYSIDINYEGIKKGLFPVDMTIRGKNQEIIAFVDILAIYCFHDKNLTILRRKSQIKEFLYHYDYPKIPFLRYSKINRRNPMMLQEVAQDILSRLNIKRKEVV
jgi:hypothetical protein